MNPAERAGVLAALAGLPGMGPKRLRLLLDHHAPGEALDLLRSQRPCHPMFERSVAGPIAAPMRRLARSVCVETLSARCREAGVVAVCRTDPEYPAMLVDDPGAPAVLFARGDFDALDARRVGVIGTRNATASGRATAHELAHALAAEGVAVVSGLARGIDGAAHEGVRRSGGPGRPIAVVGNGPDHAYPRQHAELWEWVAARGLLISEWPPGTPPDAWRFPQRNRILAALSEVVVVVESRERGGSLITAHAALDRGIEVMAVPGSPRSRASIGTNEMLADGAGVVTSAADVLAVLGLDHARAAPGVDLRPRPRGVDAAVLAACSGEPCTLDDVAARVHRDLASVAMSLARLERDGWLGEANGWFEVRASRLHPS